MIYLQELIQFFAMAFAQLTDRESLCDISRLAAAEIMLKSAVRR